VADAPDGGAIGHTVGRWRIPVETRDNEEYTTVRQTRINRHELARVVEGLTASGIECPGAAVERRCVVR
jgi:hypothetical protein